MIIKELLVHDFSEADDLMLAELAPGLNVVRVPRLRDVAVLHQFIPGMLYGSAGHGRAVYGSLVGQCKSQEIECLRLDDDQLPGLHILDANGARASTSPLLESLADWPLDGYLSVFSDALPIASRLSHWLSMRLVERFAAIDETPRRSELDSLQASLDAAESACDRKLNELIQRRAATLAELALRSHEKQDYLEARQAANAAGAQSDEIAKTLEKQQHAISLLRLTAELVAPCARERELKARVAALRASNVDAKDPKRLQQIERKMEDARQRLSLLRDEAARAAERPTSSVETDLGRLAEQRGEVAARQARRDELREQLGAAAETQERGNHAREQLLQHVRVVRTAAMRLRQARHGFREIVRRAAEPPPKEPLVPDTPIILRSGREAGHIEPTHCTGDAESPRVDPRIDDLRGRIKQLKSETRSLLQRRLLPARVALALGTAFSLGVGLVLAAVFWDLGGINISVGAIGVTTILASALLKTSFETPAAEQIKEHRRRINRLTEEVQRRETCNHERAVALDDPNREAAQTTSATLRETARRELEQAFERWRQALQGLDIRTDLKPARAVGELRRRFRASALGDVVDASELAIKLAEHEKWLQSWRQRVASALQLDPASVDSASLRNLLALLDSALAKEDQEITAVDLGDQSSVRRRIADVQQSIKDLKRSREKILHRTKATDLKHLRSLVARRRELPQLQGDLQQTQETIRSKLAKTHAAREVRELVASLDEKTLKKRLRDARSKATRLQSKLETARQQHDRAMATSSQLAQDRRAAPLCLELETLNAQLRQVGRRRQVAAVAVNLARAVSDARESSVASAAQSTLLADASRLLRAARQDDCRVQYDAKRRQFVHVDATGQSIDLREMSKNDTHLILLCIQISLARRLSAAGVPLPIVLTDVSLGYPAAHAIQVARVLVDAANQGTQVFLFTSHAAVSDLFGTFDIPTLGVERMTSDSTFEMTNAPFGDEPESLPDDLRVAEDEGQWIPVEYQVVSNASEKHDAFVQ